MDAALYIWASIERCTKPGIDTDVTAELQCDIDVSSVVESVSGIVKFVLRAVDECSTIKTMNHECASEAFLLGEGIAGLSKSSSLIALKCPWHSATAAPAPAAGPATCASYTCPSGQTLRPQPERLDCASLGCDDPTCCLLPVAAPPATTV